MIQKSQSLHVLQATCFGQTYCFDASHVMDVVPASQVQRSAAMTSSKVGTISVEHGNHSVYSLSHLIGLTQQREATNNEQVILLESSMGILALLVDVVQSRDLHIKHVAALPPVLQADADNISQAVVFLDHEASPQDLKHSAAGGASLTLLLAIDRLHARIEGRPQDFEPAESAATFIRDGSPASISNPGLSAELGRRRASLVVFSIGGQTHSPLALSVTQVVEIDQISDWLPVPKAPPHVLGLMNWRNTPAVVLDMGALLGLKTTTGPTIRRVLVARVTSSDADIVAFPIESGAKVLPVPIDSRIGRVPAGCRTDLLCGSYDIEGQHLLIPNMRQILAEL
jgi:chemotaxis signal transduction protein